MGWKSRGLRGSVFEEMVNATNEMYREKGLALVQKIPTPITPIEIDQTQRHITLAYFDQKSTVDYVGVVQGIPVCFDCKECHAESFALKNVHEHQLQFMKEFEGQQGIAFLLIYYSTKDRVYYMTLRELIAFYERARQGGRKSVAFSELNPEFFLEGGQQLFVRYLEMINLDLEKR